MSKPTSRPSFKSLLPLLALVGSLSLFALFIFHFENPISHDDGLRHLAMAKLYQDLGIEAVRGWGYFFYEGIFTIYNTDPWFLADLSLIPLTRFSDAVALKIFTLISIALIGTAFILHLRFLRMRPTTIALLLLILFFGNSYFTGRLLLGRPYSITIVLTLLTLLSLRMHRPVLTGVLLAISVLYSQLFVFPLFIIALWGLLEILRGRFPKSLILWTVLGLLAGFALHPEPLIYLQYLLYVFMRLPFLKHIGLGSEMNTGVGDGSFLMFVFGIAVWLHTIMRKRGTKFPDSLLFLEGIVGLLMLMFMVWLRSIDLLWPLLLLLIAEMSVADRGALPALRQSFTPKKFGWQLRFVCVLVCALVFVRIGLVITSFSALNAHNDVEKYRAALKDVPSGARVLNLDWHFLPMFVAARPDLKYATGIDAGFAYIDNPKASEIISLIWTPAFMKDRQVADASVWLTELREHVDGDYLAVDTHRIGGFAPSLRSIPELQLLSHVGTMLVFKMDKSEPKSP